MQKDKFIDEMLVTFKKVYPEKSEEYLRKRITETYNTFADVIDDI